MRTEPPLIVHVIHRLGVGGLENGLVNLVNHTPADRYRHAIVCLTEAAEFRSRIAARDVRIVELGKQPGHDWGLYGRLWRTLRDLRPDILHTRNLGALDSVAPARLARVAHHVHGLHGWDAADLHGSKTRHALLRRLCDPFTDRYIAVSRDLAAWLVQRIGIAPHKVVHVSNGVDTQRFRPCTPRDRTAFPESFQRPDTIVFGWIGRLDPVKNPLALLEAFEALLDLEPRRRAHLRLMMIGAGPLADECARFVTARRLEGQVWLPGARDDVPELLRGMDAFVLPSLNEGISNTILEAMASGLAVIATRVGGNPELIAHDETGTLVPNGEPGALAAAMRRYVREPSLAHRHGAGARQAVEANFSLARMVAAYVDIYDSLLRGPASCAA